MGRAPKQVSALPRPGCAPPPALPRTQPMERFSRSLEKAPHRPIPHKAPKGPRLSRGNPMCKSPPPLFPRSSVRRGPAPKILKPLVRFPASPFPPAPPPLLFGWRKSPAPKGGWGWCFSCFLGPFPTAASNPRFCFFLFGPRPPPKTPQNPIPCVLSVPKHRPPRPLPPRAPPTLPPTRWFKFLPKIP